MCVMRSTQMLVKIYNKGQSTFLNCGIAGLQVQIRLEVDKCFCIQWGSEIRTCPVFEWLKKVGLGPDHSKTELLDSLDRFLYKFFLFLYI